MTSSITAGVHDSVMSCSGSSDNNCTELTHNAANILAPLSYSSQLSADSQLVNGTSHDNAPLVLSQDDSHRAPIASCEEDEDLCLNVVSCDEPSRMLPRD